MKLLASGQFGNVVNPFAPTGLNNPRLNAGTQGQGIILILTSLVRFVIVLAALYAFFNLILAGYGFMSAGGDPKNIAKAWEKIWQSILGLIIISGSFILAILIGFLVFGPTNAFILVQPQIFTP